MADRRRRRAPFEIEERERGEEEEDGDEEEGAGEEEAAAVQSLHDAVREKWVRVASAGVAEEMAERGDDDGAQKARSFFEKLKREVEALGVCLDRTDEHIETRKERSEVRNEWKKLVQEMEVLRAFGWNPYTRRYCRPHWTAPESEGATVRGASWEECLRHTRFWIWRFRSEQFIIAFSYLMGAIMFIWGSITSLFQAVDDSTPLYSGITLTPYLIGGIFFFIGTAAMLVASYHEINERDKIRDEIIAELEEDMRRRRELRNKIVGELEHVVHGAHDAAQKSTETDKETIRLVSSPTHFGVGRRIRNRRRERRRRRRARVHDMGSDGDADADEAHVDPEDEEREEEEELQHLGRREQIQLQHLGAFWTQIRVVLDISGALFFMIGVICYLIGTIAPYWSLSSSIEVVWVTNAFNVGGATFVAGSYCYLASATESFFALRWHPRSFALWTAWLNLIGSVLYLLGSAITRSSINSTTLIASWLPIFIGFTIGSLIFVIAAYLMILDMANNS